MSNSVENLQQYFESLGLSKNETKVYLALVEHQPITGYQLSKKSGLLKPIVYEILPRLLQKGGAKIIKASPDIYEAIDIKTFIDILESHFSNAKKEILDYFSKHEFDTNLKEQANAFWNVFEKTNIYQLLKAEIENAKKSILFECQLPDLFNNLDASFNKMLDQNIEINAFSYYQIQKTNIALYTYHLNSSFSHKQIHKNTISLVIDNKKAILANLDDKGSACVSENKSFVQNLATNINYNIYILRLIQLIGISKLKMVMSVPDESLFEMIEKEKNHL